jgi:hypothetical protein
MAPRHPGKFLDSLRNEGHSFIRPAISWRIIGSRTLIPAARCRRPPAPSLAQTNTPNARK